MALVLVVALVASSVASPSGHKHRPVLPSDTLAWVSSQAITAADLIRRVEFMPFEGKVEANPLVAKQRALESLVGEALLAREAEQHGVGKDRPTILALGALERALLRDALYRTEVMAKVQLTPTADEPEAAHSRASGSSTIRRQSAARDSMQQVRARTLAFALMTHVLAGQRALIDRDTFLHFADSLRVILAAGDSAHSAVGGYEIAAEQIGTLEVRLQSRLDHVLVRLPADSLRLGEVLEDFRFYRFMVKSLERDAFRSELDQALHQVVEGELLAADARRRHLDLSDAVQRDLSMWAAAWRADLIAQQIAAEARWTDDDAFRQLAIYHPERARGVCEVDVQEILCRSQTEALAVAKRLHEGANFDSIATRTTCRGDWAANGGRSGFFHVRQHPELGYASLLSPADSLIGPLRLPEGWSIFRVLGKRLDPDSLAAHTLMDQAREIAAAEKRREIVMRHVARLAQLEDIHFDFASLPQVQILPQNMLTRRALGFGGTMLAAPTLSPDWDWVPIWQEAQSAPP